jgi:hypothetical protein
LFPPTRVFAQSTTSGQTAQAQPAPQTDATVAAPDSSTKPQTQTQTATLATTADSSAGFIGGINTPDGTKVSAGGSTTQTMPIVIPAGTAGIQPHLSFVYNSQGENGLLGVGWSVSGLPVVHRCPRTVAQDNFRGGINYDTNDRFCLDGARLMVVNGMAYGADGAEYRTEVDTFLKIFSFGQAGSGPAYFTVQTKGGETMTFGATEDSRIQAVGKADARIWALNKLQDIKGNYLTVAYAEDVNNGEYRPLQIDYTGNTAGGLATTRHVVFEYNAPYNPRTDQIPLYIGGSKILTTKLLTNVKTYQGGTTPETSNLVRDYRVTYETGTATNRSRLTSITECASDGSCMPANTYTWQEGGSGFQSPQNWGSYSGNGAHFIGDFNGDGRMDYLYANNGIIQVQLSNGAGFDAPVTWGTYTVIGSGQTKQVGDVNGDGKLDFVISDNGNIKVYLSTGSSFAAPVNWGTYSGNGLHYIGDFNGDGKMDYFYANDGVIQVQLSNGAGFEAPVTWGTYVILGSGQTRQFGDFNGDGKLDFVIADNGNIKVYLSTGSSFAAPVNWGTYSGNGTHRIGDFDGDGKSDYSYANNSVINIQIANGPFADLITNITNSFGGQTAITYKPLTDGSVYVKETSAVYPDVDVQYPLYVVSDITVSDGVGAPYNYEYTYVGAKANFLGRGSLGFHQTLAVDHSADSKTTTSNNQTFPKIGLPDAIEVDRLSDGAAFRDMNYDYQTDNPYPSAPTVSFVQVSRQDTVEWEGGQTSRTIREEMSYDSTTTGNLAQVHHFGDFNAAGDERYEITDWIVDTNNWLHRPKRQALLDSTGSVVLREKWLYYDGQNYGQIGAFGLLTKEELNGGNGQGTGNNPVTTYVNDPAFGVRTSVTDPRGCQTTTVYESTKTYPQTVTNCLSHSASYTYDPNFGVKKTEQDPNGQLTTYDYDTFGRLTAVIGPLDSEANPTISYSYVAWGSPTQQHVQALRGGTVV